MKHLFIIPILFLFTLTSLLSGQTTVAIVDFEGKGVSQTESSALTDRFGSELFNLGVFSLIERSQMNDILEEQGFQQTGCVSAECAVEVGKMVGAEQIITGSISHIGNVFSVSSKIVDVESGRILKMSTYDFEGMIGDLLRTGMRNAVLKLVSGKTPELVVSTGSLYVLSDPSGASVWIDNTEVDGVTPVMIKDQTTGLHSIRVEIGDYSGSRSVEVLSDEINSVNLNLKLVKSNLNVFSSPSGASVYVDGEQYGVTPTTVKDLTVGHHDVRLDKGKKFLEYSGVVDIKKDSVNTLEVTLLKTPTLLVDSSPSGSEISIFGLSQGFTPSDSISLGSPGTYQVTLTKTGYLDYSETVSVDKDETKRLDIVLEKIPSLTIESIPSGALITIFGTERGYTPSESIQLPPGYYPITLSKPLYENYTDSITLSPDDEKEMTVNLVKESGSIDIKTSTPSTFVLHDENGGFSSEGQTSTILENIPTSEYTLLVESDGFLSVKKKVTVNHNVTTTIDIKMTSIEEIENRISVLESRKRLWMIGSVSLFGLGGLLNYISDQTYQEYLTSRDNVNQLRERFELLDQLSPVSIGLGSLMGLVFVIENSKNERLKRILDRGIISDTKN
jgi:TolB-like protein